MKILRKALGVLLALTAALTLLALLIDAMAGSPSLMQSLLEKLTTAGGVDLAVSDTTFTMTFRDIGAVGTIEIPEEARAAE